MFRNVGLLNMMWLSEKEIELGQSIVEYVNEFLMTGGCRVEWTPFVSELRKAEPSDGVYFGFVDELIEKRATGELGGAK